MLSLFIALLQQLTEEQIFGLSMLVLFIIQAIKIVWVGLLNKPKPSKGVTRFGVFVLSFPIGFVFSGAELPVWDGDPMQFANDVLTFGGAVLIFAGLVYDYIVDGLFEWLDSKVLRRDGRSAILAP